jgi:hypothetical protein
MLLWDLWYSIIHHARRTSWRDTAAHTRLIALVTALKARPDPPQPAPMTDALWANMLWGDEPGVVWSQLLFFGMASLEGWCAP